MGLIMDLLVGHRGAAKLAPENTLAGIRKAAELGLKWIELDVTLLGDGSAVIFHDEKVGRTTSGQGRLKQWTLGELRKLDAGSWHSDSYHGEPVPTLPEALLLIKELGLGLNLELKPNGCNLKALVERVGEALVETEFPDPQLLVSSFNHKALILYRKKRESRIACLFEKLPQTWRSKAQQVNASAIHLNGEILTEKKAHEVKSAGYELYCYTVNDKALYKKLLNYGVDGVFTDDPSGIEL